MADRLNWDLGMARAARACAVTYWAVAATITACHVYLHAIAPPDPWAPAEPDHALMAGAHTFGADVVLWSAPYLALWALSRALRWVIRGFISPGKSGVDAA